MGLAVDAEQPAIGVGHRQRVEARVAGALVPAERQDYAKLPRQAGKARQHPAATEGFGEAQMAMVLLDAEVRGGEQLLQQDQLRAPGSRFADQALGAVEIVVETPATGELGSGQGQVAHRSPPRRPGRLLLGDAMHAAAAVGQVVDAHRHHLASGEGPGQGSRRPRRRRRHRRPA